jgi:long-chain fatty acid transport protein
MAAEADDEIGVGWNVGVYYQPRPKLSLGLTYRSAIAIDHDGKATVTATTGGGGATSEQTLPLESRIRYPELAIFGVAFRPRPRLVLEVDVAWTGWSTFRGMTIAVPQAPELSMRVMDGFSDSVGWRGGFQYTTLTGFQYRGGVVVDDSPQPDRDLSPLLADADRVGFAIGFGYRLVDLSLMYIVFEDRHTVDSRFGVDGTYTYDAWLLGATFGF